MMPLISVILPVYNGELTIRKTVESVLSQTLSNWELIIINDGSKDSTLDILYSFYDYRLQIFSYENAGQAVSRNRGLSHAQGEYISFIDADDLWTNDKLEAQLKVLQSNPQARVAYSWTNYIDENGELILQGKRVNYHGNLYQKLLVSNFLENGSNPLICRKALDEVGGFEPSLTPAEDWDLWLRLAAKYDFVLVPCPQILYRISATSESTNLLRMETACLQVLNHRFSLASESVKSLQPESMTNLYKFLACRALQQPLNRQKAGHAVIFIWKFFIHDKQRWQNVNFSITLLCKTLIIILLPNTLSTAFLSKS